LYCHLCGSYVRVSASKPENRPSRSSASLYSSLTMTDALVYATTYSRKSRSFCRM